MANSLVIKLLFIHSIEDPSPYSVECTEKWGQIQKPNSVKEKIKSRYYDKISCYWVRSPPFCLYENSISLLRDIKIHVVKWNHS